MATANNMEFDWSYFNKAATTDNFLNRGAFGYIYGPIDWHREQYALKRIMFAGDELNDKVRNEIAGKKNVWMSLEHKNLIKIYGVELLPKALLIIMDFAAGGSLDMTLRKLTAKSKVLPLGIVSDWTKQIVEGMAYLHDRNIVHRDLKSSNIMLMKNVDPDDLTSQVMLKITDFDDIKEFEHTTTMSVKGTVPWMAPEVLEDEKFSKASDVYSFGVFLWEMLTGRVPYENESVTLKKIWDKQLKLLPLSESVPEAYKQLFSGCTNADKDERPSFRVIEAWCQGNHQMLLGERAYFERPSLIRVIKTRAAKEENVSVRAIAGLKEELFAISESSCEVEVYSLVTLDQKRRFLINELKTPLDMKSCLPGNCLVILDCIEIGHPNKILISDVQGNVEYNWEVEDSEARISVANCSGNLIITLGNHKKIAEYKCDGTQVRVIGLGDILPRHAILLANNKFLISHGRLGDAKDYLHRVFQLTVKDGETLISVGKNDKRIVNAYGEERGSSLGLMNVPWYLVVDENEFILVAERDNQRVILLNPHLKFKRVLIFEKDDLRRPLNMWMDVSSGRLFITDFQVVDHNRRDGRLLVFQIRKPN